mgnify:CR=1 FL=1
MKITKSQLKQIIFEELEDLLNEEDLGEGRMGQALGALALAGGIGAGATGINYGVGAAQDAYETHLQDRADSKAEKIGELEKTWTEKEQEIENLEMQLGDSDPDDPERKYLEQKLERAKKHLDAAKRAHAGRSALK